MPDTDIIIGRMAGSRGYRIKVVETDALPSPGKVCFSAPDNMAAQTLAEALADAINIYSDNLARVIWDDRDTREPEPKPQPDPECDRGPGWDAKAIHRVAKEVYGGLGNMFEAHGWPCNSNMMHEVGPRICHTYGSVATFERAHRGGSPLPSPYQPPQGPADRARATEPDLQGPDLQEPAIPPSVGAAADSLLHYLGVAANGSDYHFAGDQVEEIRGIVLDLYLAAVKAARS